MHTASRFSTRELQAAAVALAAGEFAEDSTPRRRTDPTANPTTGPTTGPTSGRTTRSGSSWRPDGPLVRVISGHAGAGASTITLAVADAAAASAASSVSAVSVVRVLDAAAPAWSGLVAATSTELGAADGWRRGRRGDQLVIDRLEEHVWTPDAVPVPRDCSLPVALTVLDAGWTSRELTAHPHGWVCATPTVDVVVTRATATAFGQAEVALASTVLASTVLAVIGASRWSGPEFASAGRRMRQLRESDSITFVPLLGGRALNGLRGPGPLPPPLISSAQRLLDRLTTLTGPLPASGPNQKEQT